MLIVDTGALVAATDRNDPYHRVCAALLNNETDPLVTDGHLTVETLTREDWQRVHQLVVRYVDLRFGERDSEPRSWVANGPHSTVFAHGSRSTRHELTVLPCAPV